jgi:hypothetical protein
LATTDVARPTSRGDKLYAVLMNLDSGHSCRLYSCCTCDEHKSRTFLCEEGMSLHQSVATVTNAMAWRICLIKHLYSFLLSLLSDTYIEFKRVVDTRTITSQSMRDVCSPFLLFVTAMELVCATEIMTLKLRMDAV